MKFLKVFIKNILVLLGVFIILALVNRWYLGGFAKLEVQEQNMPSYTIAYTRFVGEYGKVWQSMNKVYEALSGAGIFSSTGVGIYYDDPATISWSDLRSDVGAVITPQDVRKIAKNITVKTLTIPAGTKMVVVFPFKSSLSYIVGPMKAYPMIAKYMKSKGYVNQVPMTELYDIAAKKIYYIADITK